MVGLVAVDVLGFPGAYTGRGSCRLRMVDTLWFEGLGIPG